MEKSIFKYTQRKKSHFSNTLQCCTFNNSVFHRIEQHYLQSRKYAKDLVPRSYLAKQMSAFKKKKIVKKSKSPN